MKLNLLRIVLIFFLTSISSVSWAISTGTSFAVTKDGILLTNYHVIENSKTIIVRGNDNRFFIAEVIEHDEMADIAFLKISASTPNFLSASRSETIKKGEKIYALGFPHIDLQGGESKITEGIISSLSGYQGDESLFQISASIQSGNSGGPLIRADGTVVGIVSAKLSAAKTLKLTGDLPQNVNYAIKIDEASRLSPRFVNYLKTSTLKRMSAEDVIEKADKAVFLVLASPYEVKPISSKGLIRPYLKSAEPTMNSPQGEDIETSVNASSINQEDSPALLTTADLTDKGIQAYNEKNYNEALEYLTKAAEKENSFAQYHLGLYYWKGDALEADYTKSKFWFEKAAEQGIADAQKHMGLLYSLGLIGNPDYSRAAFWFQKAINQGIEEPLIQTFMGYLYDSGIGVSKNPQKAYEFFVQSGNKNESTAEAYIGMYYRDGIVVSQDYEQAINWFQRSADHGNSGAFFPLGALYLKGKGVPKNERIAFEMYSKGAEKGDKAAQYGLGMMYSTGNSVVEKDDAQGFIWLLKAAEQGLDFAQYWVGFAYEYGLGVQKNLKYAFDWYLKSAVQGDSSSQNKIGDFYRYGIDVKQDYVKALEWYVKSANNGSALAQNSLAFFYYKGLGGLSQNNKSGFNWDKKAAELGLAGAQFNIGRSFHLGLGIEKDLSQAIFWYKKAAMQGDANAQNNLGILLINGQGVNKNTEEGINWLRKSDAQGLIYQGKNYPHENLENISNGLNLFLIY